MRPSVLLLALLGAGCSSGEKTVEKPIDSAPTWTLKFSNATSLAEAGTGRVSIAIEKFERGLGKVTAKHVHLEGSRIGWWPEAPEGESVSFHAVRMPGGKTEKVDFNTGMTLKSVHPVKKAVTVKRCKPIFGKGDGEKVSCEVFQEQRMFACYEILYGPGAEARRMNVPEPTSLNQLCPLHEWNPDASVSEERVKEARTLLAQADRLWATNSAAGSKTYRRLLADYKDMVLFLEVRTRVESRARHLDE